MAFSLPPLPNFTTTPPAQPDILQKYGQLASLKNMQSEQALRQQLAPLDVQEAQQRVQQQTTANQVSQIQLQTMLAQNKYWSDPASFSVDNPGAQPGNDKLAGMLGVSADDPILAMVHGQMKAGVPGNAAIAEAKQTLSFRQEVAKTTDEQQKILDDSIDKLKSIAAPISAESDPTKKAAMIQQALPTLTEIAKPSPSVSQMIPKLNAQNFDAFVNRIGAEQNVIDYRSKSADLWKKELENATTADPLLKMSMNPMEAFSGDKLPASMAFLQSKVKDPDPKVAAQATSLLGQAKAAEKVELSIDAQKKAAAQAIADGDPAAAAKLLINGDVAPSQLISARKPEFAQKAFTLAEQLSGGKFNAQKAESDFVQAKAPANLIFFGSAKSLTDQGGLLDQLKAAGDAIPGGKIPVFNKIEDVVNAATGSGPVAKYASVLLGMSDDYAKVVGGGSPSLEMQRMALGLAPASASPEQRAAAIDGIRGTVASQTRSRIGNNTVLQKQFGTEPAAQPFAGQTLTSEMVTKAAKDHGISEAEVKAQAKAHGIKIQGE